MNDKSRTLKRSAPHDVENVCSDCLFFQPHPASKSHLRGNCTYHKQWIENSSRTTCSDMSKHSLQQKGIYKLVPNGANAWLHVRRAKKIRTRLFLIKGLRAGQRTSDKKHYVNFPNGKFT